MLESVACDMQVLWHPDGIRVHTQLFVAVALTDFGPRHHIYILRPFLKICDLLIHFLTPFVQLSYILLDFANSDLCNLCEFFCNLGFDFHRNLSINGIDNSLIEHLWKILVQHFIYPHIDNWWKLLCNFLVYLLVHT